jgi:hypothetical protein
LSAVYLIVFFQEPFHPAYGIGLVCVIGGGLVNHLQRKNRKTDINGDGDALMTMKPDRRLKTRR